METILNDAFHPKVYSNFVSTQTVARNNQIITFILVAGGLIILGVVWFKYHEENKNRKIRERKN